MRALLKALCIILNLGTLNEAFVRNFAIIYLIFFTDSSCIIIFVVIVLYINAGTLWNVSLDRMSELYLSNPSYTVLACDWHAWVMWIMWALTAIVNTTLCSYRAYLAFDAITPTTLRSNWAYLSFITVIIYTTLYSNWVYLSLNCNIPPYTVFVQDIIKFKL